MNFRQPQLVPMVQAAGPIRAKSAKHPQPRLPSQSTSGATGSSAQAGLRSGRASIAAASAAAMPVAMEAKNCDTSSGSSIRACRSGRNPSTATATAMTKMAKASHSMACSPGGGITRTGVRSPASRPISASLST